MPDGEWRSYHLYRAEPWEPFLRGAVRPFISTVLEESLAERFFFVRYWERGPHIRLRLHTAHGAELDSRVHAHFNDYFRLHPSVRGHSAADSFPNDTVQEMAYVPEVQRYGGPHRLPVAEEHFEASSRAVLAILEHEEWSYERALGSAIQLHLLFLSCLGLQDQALLAYLCDTSEKWLWTSPAFQQSFEAAYQRSKPQLIAVHEAIAGGVPDELEIQPDWAACWVRAMRTAGRALHAEDAEFPRDASDRSIVTSLIHMTNNRLGLRNSDEASLFYLMKRAAEDVHGIVA